MSSWHRLPLSSPPNPLYYLFLPTDSSYAIHLTDLRTLWTQSLTRRDIYLEALTKRTTIDPSEDASQRVRLLEELERCLAGEPNTSLATSSDTSTSEITLNLTVDLPSPLRPLKWTMTATQAGPTAFSDTVLQPLLASCRDLQKQTEELLAVIKAKDIVIDKMSESCESTERLGDIFPGPSIRNGRPRSKQEPLSRADVEARVIGMKRYANGSAKYPAVEEVKALWARNADDGIILEDQPTLSKTTTDTSTGFENLQKLDRDRTPEAPSEPLAQPPPTPSSLAAKSSSLYEQTRPYMFNNASPPESFPAPATSTASPQKKRLGAMKHSRSQKPPSPPIDQAPASVPSDGHSVVDLTHIQTQTQTQSRTSASQHFAITGGTLDSGISTTASGSSASLPRHLKTEYESITSSGRLSGEDREDKPQELKSPKESAQEKATRKRAELKAEAEKQANAHPQKKKRRF